VNPIRRHIVLPDDVRSPRRSTRYTDTLGTVRFDVQDQGGVDAIPNRPKLLATLAYRPVGGPLACACYGVILSPMGRC